VQHKALRTTLTEFFVNNATDVDARQHLYHEYPEHLHVEFREITLVVA